ncbi:MAG: glutathione S-transferase N-terminal domain-containing protein [Deltaproteobacteria bacterium]|nr:glutathione S-transferase N-terminal domain-containing protein [Deltaproteobacteria bacterium]MBI3388384.1 glutathione S-transferase N-terminal domain-containing protein [Deltaproteobacteria bacterium]
MIDLYTWTTPNGRKVSIMLEETGLAYNVFPVSLPERKQFEPAFTALNPNQRIPVLVDHDLPDGPLAIIESGAILIHLAEKTGKCLPRDVRGRSEVLQWLMFQMGGIGPMMGQAGYFANTAEEKIPFAIQRYINESVRLIGVLNTRLADRNYLGGEYSIADMATYPWVAAGWGIFKTMMPEQIGKLGHVQRWLDAVAARPAVQRGMAVPVA